MRKFGAAEATDEHGDDEDEEENDEDDETHDGAHAKFEVGPELMGVRSYGRGIRAGSCKEICQRNIGM